jgi:hypothetical protein
MKERRETAIAALIETDEAATQGDHNKLPTDDSIEEENSMDFLDLTMESSIHEEGSMEATFEIYSHQVY